MNRKACFGKGCEDEFFKRYTSHQNLKGTQHEVEKKMEINYDNYIKQISDIL